MLVTSRVMGEVLCLNAHLDRSSQVCMKAATDWTTCFPKKGQILGYLVHRRHESADLHCSGYSQ